MSYQPQLVYRKGPLISELTDKMLKQNCPKRRRHRKKGSGKRCSGKSSSLGCHSRHYLWDQMLSTCCGDCPHVAVAIFGYSRVQKIDKRDRRVVALPSHDHRSSAKMGHQFKGAQDPIINPEGWNNRASHVLDDLSDTYSTFFI
jgi:hypothetical protein